ncbi:hypothetical protein [Campylobacter sp. US33a]|uniref:hypothetical protein n=1 Tax=Campylobacter sp. US33a TaxID=2498120 RepID=UPI001068B0E2|nr:hypothetical protein [Campylobacter sp. US33a]TEY00721.1 hypothetical protein ELQ16_08790 [Campylobacter sp. US33a]
MKKSEKNNDSVVNSEFIEVPLSLYCSLAGITEKTAYNRMKKGELRVCKKEHKNFVLVNEKQLFILNKAEQIDKLVERRSIKKSKELDRKKIKKVIIKVKSAMEELEETIKLLG